MTGAPHIRFYAGMPLTGSGGHPLGTLCVIDSRPRQLSAQQRDGLQRLARQVVQLCELRLSQRRQAEQAALQRAILDSAGSAIVTTDAAGHISGINPAAEQLLGFSRQQLLGQPLATSLLGARRRDAADEEESRQTSPDCDLAALLGRAAKARVEPFEWTYIRQDGSRLPLLLTLSTIQGEGGQPLGFVIIAQDLGPLEAAQQRLRHIAAQIPGMVFQAQLREQGTVRFPMPAKASKTSTAWPPRTCTSAARRSSPPSTGRPRDGRRLHPALGPRTRPLAAGIPRAAPAQGADLGRGSGHPRRQPDGSVIWHGVLTDISARKRQQALLEQQEEMNQRLLEALAEGVVACDAQGNLTLFNETARRWHGTDIGQLPPEQWGEYYDLFEADGLTPLAEAQIPLLRALRGERVRQSEISILAKGQAPRLVSTNAAPCTPRTAASWGPWR
ncbi:PAS domain-containing protein [Pseudomonas lalucatii]|nr:PAS domain-containing protein [Pseudomonas lalucatii]